MNEKSARQALRVSIEKRILNEFGSKILNEERMDKVMHARKNRRLEEHSAVEFGCECDSEDCEETISMSSEEYLRMHQKTKYFVVVPSHVRFDLEEVITTFGSYALVAKFFPHSKAH
jgi:hypothetical protein